MSSSAGWLARMFADPRLSVQARAARRHATNTQLGKRPAIGMVAGRAVEISETE